MRPKKTNTSKDSWYDQFSQEEDQNSSWLDVYRKHLTWIRTSDLDENDSIRNDFASEL
jgi:hypothetical protein